MDNTGRNFRKHLLGLKKGYRHAGFWRRLGGFVIDLFILNIVFSPLASRISGYEFGVVPGHVYSMIIFMSIIALLYFSLFQFYFRQTIGMMMLKTYVVPEPGFWRCVGRNIFILPFFPFNLLWIIEPVHLYFKGTRVLEIITKTETVENGKN